MTTTQRHERINFELRHLRWQALHRGYSLRELEQQLARLVERFSVDTDPAWLRAQLEDFRVAMARELLS